MTARSRGRTHRTVSRWVAGAAIGASVLAGCSGTPTADTAAVVNGTALSESDVQESASQLTTAVSQSQPISAQRMLDLLIRYRVINEVTSERGRAVSPSVAIDGLKQRGVADPNPYAVEVLRGNMAEQSLDEATAQEVVKRLSQLKVTVNPRYGEWGADPTGQSPLPALIATTPDWLTPQGTPAAQPTG